MSNLDYKTVFRQEQDRLRCLHPIPSDIPSCFSLFDDYVSCAGGCSSFDPVRTCLYTDPAIRSQIKSIYRYGERPQCSSKFEEFKFCMTLKSLHPEERHEAWINRRAEWWAYRRINKSSEDVWDVREEPLQSFPRPITDDILKTMD